VMLSAMLFAVFDGRRLVAAWLRKVKRV